MCIPEPGTLRCTLPVCVQKTQHLLWPTGRQTSGLYEFWLLSDNWIASILFESSAPVENREAQVRKLFVSRVRCRNDGLTSKRVPCHPARDDSRNWNIRSLFPEINLICSSTRECSERPKDGFSNSSRRRNGEQLTNLRDRRPNNRIEQ
jgi:hypothetical protein